MNFIVFSSSCFCCVEYYWTFPFVVLNFSKSRTFLFPVLNEKQSAVSEIWTSLYMSCNPYLFNKGNLLTKHFTLFISPVINMVSNYRLFFQRLFFFYFFFEAYFDYKEDSAFPKPPSYNVATSLPSYDEAERSKAETFVPLVAGRVSITHLCSKTSPHPPHPLSPSHPLQLGDMTP